MILFQQKKEPASSKMEEGKKREEGAVKEQEANLLK